MKQLEFTTLKLFAAVAESGSVSAAAEKSHLTIAAVSKRIRDLEQSVGSQLFLRHARGMTLTLAGQALLKYAREIVFTVDRMEGELRQIAKGLVGTVRVAAAGSAIAHFLPEDLKQFADRHPNVAIDLSEESTSDEVLAALVEGRVDIGILFGPLDNPALTAYEYHRDSLCLVVPRGHALARFPKVRFADALVYDFIAPARRSSVMQMLLAHSGGALKTRIHVRSNDAICRMVGAGMGVGICPTESARGYRRPHEIRFLELDEPWAQRQLVIAVRAPEQGLSGAAQLFLAHCRDMAQQDREASAPVAPAPSSSSAKPVR
ncbi:LysR substrate-binding domain-containing protein [Hydrogenophaga sp. BPS33]|uniref:LysR substrate-binding domain-containing protein n=1 Tax=Hydrogenophaga sp. BPS33 TaxID=2651974 RepID=UPI0013595803|nr:LysR substrate-binding domain-containing protein [Hydrogenophaga sp. BPS33]